MRRSLVAGNWKLNGTDVGVQSLASEVAAALIDSSSVDVVVCPVYVHLHTVRSCIASSPIKLGAQDVCDMDSGAFTGEVSAPMLAESGCEYVIVGHSERRSIYRESDEDVAKKFAAAQRGGLIPILCVGESLQERESDQTEAVVGRQLDAVIANNGIESLANAVVAYEPVWAIGTGKTASPEQAQSVHAFIRQRVADQSGQVADGLRILYGGSVKPDNAAELFSMNDIDGGLIGGAALKSSDFLAICDAAA